MAPRWIRSRIQWYRMSIALERFAFKVLLAMPTAHKLSHNMGVAERCGYPRVSKITRSHTACCALIKHAAYSASVTETQTVGMTQLTAKRAPLIVIVSPWLPQADSGQILPKHVINKYGLHALVHNNAVLFKINKCMYGLPQAGLLSFRRHAVTACCILAPTYAFLWPFGLADPDWIGWGNRSFKAFVNNTSSVPN